MARSVFYSFNYDDVHRVQLVENINALHGQPILQPQAWESVRRQGDRAIETWIDQQMKGKSAVIVLIGPDTASRPWVRYEIKKAWQDRRPLLGVCIHGISSFGTVARAGANPFEAASGVPAARIPIFDPTRRNYAGQIDSKATYAELTRQLEGWSTRGVTGP
ncbi:TIR domain-containing protein [Cellulosimicrobium funkei]|uniref:TIR domain-containing protein n=1 Tax=Cellulosimicrobium funkei TaxID=264251 RepID=UPI003756AC9E